MRNVTPGQRPPKAANMYIPAEGETEDPGGRTVAVDPPENPSEYTHLVDDISAIPFRLD
jgi:hypothetical protein